ncbi:hypothetical protein C8R48DRAFT_621555, partial [Suillus tomentosus]
LLFKHSYVVNGDDYLAIVSGAKNIAWRDDHCEGLHGLSVGSLGAGGRAASVANAYLRTQLCRKRCCHQVWIFKIFDRSCTDSTSVTWKDITFIDATFPIYVSQSCVKILKSTGTKV